MSEAVTALSADHFLKFRELIYAKCGIFFAEEKKYLLEARLARRVEALRLKDAGEYLMYLRYDPKAQEEMNRLFDEITINETYFFRTPPQFDALRDLILPERIALRKGQGRRELRLWSAACSSGEEPYTMAIILRELLGAELPSWRIRLFANDLSSKMLDAAKAGKYADYSTRHVPPAVRAKYFKPSAGGLLELVPEVRQMVTFELANLLTQDHLLRTREMDVIFCRNVLIYFDTPAKKTVVSSFYDSLAPGGALIIGPSESLHGITQAFKMVHCNQAVIYRKG